MEANEGRTGALTGQSTPNPTASANPRALATLTGLLNLRPGPEPACEIRDDGSCLWRLTHGITVELRFDEGCAPHWHLDRDG